MLFLPKSRLHFVNQAADVGLGEEKKAVFSTFQRGHFSRKFKHLVSFFQKVPGRELKGRLFCAKRECPHYFS